MCAKAETESSGSRAVWIIGGISAFVVVALWLTKSWTHRVMGVSADPEENALFGDSYGALNALFSGLAFVGVIVAILLQREQLKEQRREIGHQVEQFKATAEANREAAKALENQAMELRKASNITAMTACLSARDAEIGRIYKHHRGSAPLMRPGDPAFIALEDRRNSLLRDLEKYIRDYDGDVSRNYVD